MQLLLMDNLTLWTSDIEDSARRHLPEYSNHTTPSPAGSLTPLSGSDTTCIAILHPPPPPCTPMPSCLFPLPFTFIWTAAGLPSTSKNITIPPFMNIAKRKWSGHSTTESSLDGTGASRTLISRRSCTMRRRGLPGRAASEVLNIEQGYHPSEAYPPPPSSIAEASSASIVAAYQMPSKLMKSQCRPSSSLSQPPASSSKSQPVASSNAAKDAALEETNKGLRKDRERQPERKKKRKSGPREDNNFVLMGQILLIISKSSGTGYWANPREPDIAMMEKQGLAVHGLRDRLGFNKDWDTSEMDDWFRTLFHDWFAYMDRLHPLPDTTPPTFHWRLMIRSSSKLSVSPNKLNDGTERKRVVRRIHGQNSKEHRKKIAASKQRKVEDSDERVKRDAHGQFKGATPSRAPWVISVVQSEDFPATINIAPSAFATLPPTVETPAPAAAPHPTLGLTPTTPFERSRPLWLPDYSIDGSAYLRWNDSDFEVDPFFWTRPTDEG
ncbi:hypothetical protein DFH07DRAFT_970989 [Mycena maculata]|uniref:Uncharacterized protein n=1 Tax=Mycena maculata TaxID=230809 RepID=A0AAD7HPA4_9AGAR|nr:hypothetical protein DFH07DRAFT_970989 [Mycena maculata]